MKQVENKHTEKSVQESLKHFISQPRFLLKNLFVFNWESDMLFLTKSGYWYEIEVKVSRADFFNDTKKGCDVYNGLIIERQSKSDLLKNGATKSPNYFYYAVPDGLIKEDEVPDYAGLIYVKNGFYLIQKQAPKLRKDKIDPNTMGLLDKFYYNMVNAKDEATRAKREVNETHNKYSNIKEVITNQRSIEKN